MSDSRGSSLIEVVVSLLLLAMMTAPIMSAALGAQVFSGRSDRRLAAAAAVHRLSEHLKPYVTADRTAARGPGQGPDGWTLPGDESRLAALESGHHDLQAAQWASALAPYSGNISYDVVVRDTPSGPEPDVRFTVTWVEP
jgi:hypothetical protein